MIDALKNLIEVLAPDSLLDGIGIQSEILVKYSLTPVVTETEITSVAEKIALLLAINLVTFNFLFIGTIHFVVQISIVFSRNTTQFW